MNLFLGPSKQLCNNCILLEDFSRLREDKPKMHENVLKAVFGQQPDETDGGNCMLFYKQQLQS